MHLFHKHDWSEWKPVSWQTTKFVNAPEPIFHEHKGILRVCLGCGKEQQREGTIWQDLVSANKL